MTVEIFATNYRGFKTLDLNMDKNLFLVGDNSSGKSSILHLIAYVYDSELAGHPALDENHAYDPYDFFSPYFEYADVSVGFLSREKKTVGAKAITIRKGKDFTRPQITRFTTIYGNARLTLVRMGAGGISYKVTECSAELDMFELKSMHFETTGFKKLKLEQDELDEADEDGLNSPSLIFSIVRSIKTEAELTQRVLRGSMVGFLPSAVHSGPLRGLPERFYTFERKYRTTGSHFASMWHDLHSENNAEALQIVRLFGKQSLLFEDINVEKVSKKIPNSPLIVTVTKRNREFLLNQVGVGISQVIPIIIDSVYRKSVSANVIMLLQQPELHLHPIAQAALGEFLFKMSVGGLYYLIETHSDFLIDRFRANMRENPNQVGASILFCENRDDGNYCHTIAINASGEIVDAPDNYKDFFVTELMRTMF